MENKTVLIRAEVIRTQEGVLTVKLCDGFACAVVVVHESHALPDTPKI